MLFDYLQQRVPESGELIRLGTEELAALILGYAQAGGDRSYRGTGIFDIHVRGTVDPYSSHHMAEIKALVAEARQWLINEGLIIQAPGQSEGYYSLTTRGREVNSADRLQAYQESKLLRKDLLHPRIAELAWEEFRRGDYDKAVFAAFKEIEVAVRLGGGFSTRELGTDLMRRAFNPDTGTLRDPGTIDPSATRSEQQAMADLFAGAIGLFKNPQSHRYVGITDAKRAIEVLMFASLLYRLLEDRLNGLGIPLPS